MNSLRSVPATYLDRIVDAHRARARADTRDVKRLIDQANEQPPPRPFRQALADVAARDGIAVIAEVKRRSPSKGALAPDLDPRVLAEAYRDGGAACLSVLTDTDFFGGSSDDLQAAREASGLPVLRKDFTVCAADVCDARIMGADCVLLIVAALSDAELAEFAGLARQLGLDALFEIHDEHEWARIAPLTPMLVGVNQRDLVTFHVDQARAVRMADVLPESAVRVAESGIRGKGDARVLKAAGYHALLVGETLVKAGDPKAAVRELRGR